MLATRSARSAAESGRVLGHAARVAGSSSSANRLIPSDRRTSSTSDRSSSQQHYDVILNHLPHTTTYNDIRMLCYAYDPSSPSSTFLDTPQPKAIARQTASQSTGSVLSDLIGMRLVRSPFLTPTGQARVSFRSEVKAQNFARLVNRKVLGGKTIAASLAKRTPQRRRHGADNSGGDADEQSTWTVRDHSRIPRSVALLEQMQTLSPGRVVLLKGLPIHLTAERLERLLSRTYSLATDSIEWTPPSEYGGNRRERRDGSLSEARPPRTQRIGAIVQLHNVTPVQATSSFLVRVGTVADAMRLVRKWHRSPWESSSPQSRQQQEEEKQRQEERQRGRVSKHVTRRTVDQQQQHLDGDEDGASPLSDSSVEFDPHRFPLITDAYIMY